MLQRVTLSLACRRRLVATVRRHRYKREEDEMKRLFAVLLVMFAFGCATGPVGGGSGKAAGGTTLVCHKGKKTLNLPRDAVRAHLDHGDHLGSCH